jgi:hypothetical protein
MIDLISIKGEEYPFHFSHKAFYMFTQANGLRYDEINGALAADYDNLMKVFAYGSQCGAQKAGRPDRVIGANEFEDLFTENPALFDQLMDYFRQAMTSMFAPKEGQSTPGKS